MSNKCIAVKDENNKYPEDHVWYLAYYYFKPPEREFQIVCSCMSPPPPAYGLHDLVGPGKVAAMAENPQQLLEKMATLKQKFLAYEEVIRKRDARDLEVRRAKYAKERQEARQAELEKAQEGKPKIPERKMTFQERRSALLKDLRYTSRPTSP